MVQRSQTMVVHGNSQRLFKNLNDLFRTLLNIKVFDTQMSLFIIHEGGLSLNRTRKCFSHRESKIAFCGLMKHSSLVIDFDLFASGCAAITQITTLMQESLQKAFKMGGINTSQPKKEPSFQYCIKRNFST